MSKRLKTSTEEQQRAAIGARIREQRLLRELSLDDLAAKVGVSLPQLGKYETGQHAIDLYTLVKIARHLDCDPAYFLADFSDGHVQPALLPESIDVAQTMNGLNDRGRKFCRVLIGYVVKNENARQEERE